MILPYRSFRASNALPSFVDDAIPLYAMVERTGDGWEGMEEAALASIRHHARHLAEVVDGASALGRRAVAIRLEENCAMARTEASLAARSQGERPAPLSITLVTMAAESLLVASTGRANVLVVRGSEAHRVLGGQDGGCAVVAFDLAIADLVLLGTSAVPMDLKPEQLAVVAAEPSVEAATQAVAEYAGVPGFVAPNTLIGLRVTRGRDAAAVARRATLLAGLPLLGGFSGGELLALPI